MPGFDNPTDQSAPARAPSAPRHTTASGAVGLFGLFFGLCAIFALVVTVVEWREDAARERWPLVSARVEQANIDSDFPRPGSAGSPAWRLRYRVRFEVDGLEQRATLTSRSTSSQADAAKMQVWAG